MSDQDREEFERRVGTTIRGKWTLDKLLGYGGMAAVYSGVNTIGWRGAIKILHPEIARSKDLRQRFEQEAHAVNRFQHPGAVTIHEYDVSEDGTPFLVMELLEGESLADRAKRDGGIDTKELLRLVDELLDVLAAAHAKEIIHRDIKLDNLFVLKDGRLKVLDFGIARMRQHARKTMQTRAGATLGTVPYMAPEQVKGHDIDGRADVFAVGATMFRVLAKRRIHEAANDSAMIIKMATQPAPPLESVAPSVPAAVALIVDRALAFERARRYPDASTMQSDVRAVLRDQPPPYATARLAAGELPWTTDGPAPAALGASEDFGDGPTAATSYVGAPGAVAATRDGAATSGPTDPTVVPRAGAASSGPSDLTVAPRIGSTTSGPQDATVAPGAGAASFAAVAPGAGAARFAAPAPAPMAASSTQVSFTAPVPQSANAARSGYEEPPASSAPSAIGRSLGLSSTSPTQWQLGKAPVSRVLGPSAPPRPKKRNQAMILAVAGLFFLIGIGIAITVGLRSNGGESGSESIPPTNAWPLAIAPDPLSSTADPALPVPSASGAGTSTAPSDAPGPATTGGGVPTPGTPGRETGGSTTAPPPTTPPPTAGTPLPLPATQPTAGTPSGNDSPSEEKPKEKKGDEKGDKDDKKGGRPDRKRKR